MPVKPTSQQVGPEQLRQMAQQYGLHMSDADIAFFHSSLPYGADQLALDALQSHSNVTVTNTDEHIAFLPRDSAKVGLIFYPGARVDAEAYAVFMHGLARQGYATFLVKMPLGLAFFGTDRATTLISAYPALQTWVLGGHSLGGAVAADFVATHPHVRGLLLYAASSNRDLSKRTDLAVTSTRPNFPAQTQYVAIEGGIHSFFGDYGLQEGDGQATISREEARAQIQAGSRALLKQIGEDGHRE